MPIRINLLAEQQEAEEQRRRDPAKRALWGAAFVLGLLVAWAGMLQLRVVRADSQAAAVEAKFKQIETRYNLVRTNQNQVAEITRRIEALQQLAQNRFLWATPLNALQFVVVPNVQLVRFKTEQIHTVTDASKPLTNATGVVQGTPAAARETILMKLEAKDFSAIAGDRIPRFLEGLNSQPWFRTNLMKAELTGRTAGTQTEPGESSKSFVLFTVDCKYPDRVR